MPDKVLVCQNVTCKKQGAAQVLEAFQQQAPAGVTVKSSGCLGHCGNGPMVLTEPDNYWYHQVRSQDVAKIASQHLECDRPVKAMLYPVVHAHENHVLLWAIGMCLFLFLCSLLALTVGTKYQ